MTNESSKPLSRRTFLLAGGTLGVLGALGVSTPALARRPDWTWDPIGSIQPPGRPGSDPPTQTDPELIWDDEADPVVAQIFERGEVGQVNQVLRSWTRNDQLLPDGMPPYVAEFIDHARQLPTWVEPAKLEASIEFNKKRGNYLGVLYGFGSGMMACAIPREATAVYYSKGGADMRSRIARTAKFGYDVGSPNAYLDDGEMIVSAVKTRMVHAAVRHLLPQSPGWDLVRGSQERPISQADILITWHSLATFVMNTMRSWPMQIDADEAEGFLHTWQVTAHMLGVKDEYIPATWESADAQSEQLLTPVLGSTPEGVELAQVLLDIASGHRNSPGRPFFHAYTRYILGDQIMEWLQLPREPMWDQMVRNGWPNYVRMREGGMAFPLAPELYWAFDEVLRQGIILFLSQGRPISIELPEGNREHYER
ncbi:MAG TPA: oxygenase MpaB family protein [Acidimicrobiales bacterium]|nr:oxygenase MpaB family protein [Acidimicrobiales bacterium]